jgi:hypothetical protein
VVKLDRIGDGMLFLRAPTTGPMVVPSWTAVESEAGRWFLDEARKLAGMHSGVAETGEVRRAWVVSIAKAG